MGPHQLQISCVLMMVLRLLPGNAPGMTVQLPRPAGWGKHLSRLACSCPTAHKQLAEQPLIMQGDHVWLTKQPQRTAAGLSTRLPGG